VDLYARRLLPLGLLLRLGGHRWVVLLVVALVALLVWWLLQRRR
jgi:hypothetical protein